MIHMGHGISFTEADTEYQRAERMQEQAYIDTEWMISCIDDDLGEFANFIECLRDSPGYDMVLKDLAHTVAKMERAELAGAPPKEIQQYLIQLGSVFKDSFHNYAFEVCKRRVERNS